MQYAKKLVLFVLTGVLGTNLTSLALAGEWGANQWWTLAITVLGAVLLYLRENSPTDPHMKYIITLFVPAALALQAAISDSAFTGDEVAPILLALIGAFQVRAAQNVGDNFDTKYNGQVAQAA